MKLNFRPTIERESLNKLLEEIVTKKFSNIYLEISDGYLDEIVASEDDVAFKNVVVPTLEMIFNKSNEMEAFSLSNLGERMLRQSLNICLENNKFLISAAKLFSFRNIEVKQMKCYFKQDLQLSEYISSHIKPEVEIETHDQRKYNLVSNFLSLCVKHHQEFSMSFKTVMELTKTIKNQKEFLQQHFKNDEILEEFINHVANQTTKLRRHNCISYTAKIEVKMH